MAERRRGQDPQSNPRTPYAILGLEENAPIPTVRAAYRLLVKQLHPDSGGDGADQRRLDLVIAAYKTITEQHAQRIQSAAARHRHEAPTELERLVNLARNGRSPSLRVLGVRGLRRMGGAEALRCLAQAVDDAHDTVAVAAIDALASMTPGSSVRTFERMFTRMNEERKVAVITATSGASIGGRSMGIVMRGLEDESPAVRRAALRRYAEMVR